MKTDISILLDRSGSMSSTKKDTIGGFNAFLAKQKAVPGTCALTLAQFDTVEFSYTMLAQPIASAPELTDATFVPRGGTPLLDAMARLITDTGARLKAMPEASRPEKVIIVIITDGEENSSHAFTRDQVFGMVSHQRNVYDWDFLYLGANQDAIAEAAKVGINPQFAAAYSGTAAGTRAVYNIATDKMVQMRAGVSAQAMAFSPEEREELAKDDDE